MPITAVPKVVSEYNKNIAATVMVNIFGFIVNSYVCLKIDEENRIFFVKIGDILPFFQFLSLINQSVTIFPTHFNIY